MLCVFAARVVGPSLAAAAGPTDDDLSGHEQHDDGAPCPDGDDGGPCDESCPCLCCPGHTILWSSPTAAPLVAQLPPAIERVEPSDSVPPDGNAYRIFRPPRV